MITDQHRAAFAATLPAAEAAWADAELHCTAALPPPVVTTVAAVLALDPEDLWDHVEGIHGWEPHDEGYEDAVWAAAECTDHGGRRGHDEP